MCYDTLVKFTFIADKHIVTNGQANVVSNGSNGVHESLGGDF